MYISPLDMINNCGVFSFELLVPLRILSYAYNWRPLAVCLMGRIFSRFDPIRKFMCNLVQRSLPSIARYINREIASRLAAVHRLVT